MQDIGPLTSVHPDDRSKVAENLRKRESGEIDSLHYKFRGIKKGGEIVHCEVFGRRIPYQNKTAILGTLIDITERVKAEAQIQLLNSKLEEHIIELETINKELETFSYTVSHDLRNPLQIIMGYTHVLLKEHKSNLEADRYGCVGEPVFEISTARLE